MKKRIYTIFAIIVAAIVWTGCSSDMENDILSGQAISFSCNAVNTRAQETTVSNITSFRVSAAWTKAPGDYVTNFMDGQFVEKNASGAWVYSPILYMPAYGTVDFFAYSPANASVSDFQIDAENNQASLRYDVTTNFLTQQDFMVAKAPTQNTAPIYLEFQHVLSSVTIEARNISEQDYFFRIRDVELINLYGQGTLSGGNTEEWAWSGQSSLTNYPVALNGFIDIPFGTSYVSVSNPAVGPLMVLPQIAGTDFEIVITYDILENSIEQTLIAKDLTKRIPVSDPNNPGAAFTFEMGEKYTFRINLAL